MRHIKRNIIGPRVSEARQMAATKVSQATLATELQIRGLRIDRSAIAKIETNRRPVTDIELVAIGQVLGVSTNWLLTGEDT